MNRNINQLITLGYTHSGRDLRKLRRYHRRMARSLLRYGTENHKDRLQEFAPFIARHNRAARNG